MALSDFLRRLLGKKTAEVGATGNGSPATASPHELGREESAAAAAAGIPAPDALQLKELSELPLKAAKLEDINEDTWPPKAILAVDYDKDKAVDFVMDNQETFLVLGHFLFANAYGDEGTVFLAGNCTDPYQLMRIAGTNGINFDIQTGDIIRRFQEWDDRYGIRVLAIGYDYCECVLLRSDIDFDTLAAEVYAFCPDVVDQGIGSVEDLSLALAETGRIFLWWD